MEEGESFGAAWTTRTKASGGCQLGVCQQVGRSREEEQGGGGVHLLELNERNPDRVRAQANASPPSPPSLSTRKKICTDRSDPTPEAPSPAD